MKPLPLLLVCIVAQVAQAGTPSVKRKINVKTTESIPFVSGGFIHLRDSFGDVKIEGWDRPEVEITVRKGTQKKYTSAEEGKAWEHLDRIRIEAVRERDDRLVISTAFPARNIFTRPLKGKTNADLRYHIRVPENSHVFVKHDVGVVEAANICGNIEITNRIGEVTLRLPEGDEFHVDARAGIGDVSSDFGPPTQRKLLVGALARRHAPGAGHQLYLRVGIGEINIRRLRDEQKPPTGIVWTF